ncbi:endonuclease/exonuclease/phosphatase family protein [Poriferisphaera sp. WC338]|uniref:endonuclease/exonuclease/phosphatase family protein n=1 Tax=Poriferisphaera sp. WC338 TaxID=3425129 RepID=UPI003D813EC0
MIQTTIRMRLLLGAFLLLTVLMPSLVSAQDFVRIATYNQLHGPSGTTEVNNFKTIVQGMANENVGGRSKTLDVIAVQETNSSSLANARNALNQLYGAGTYNTFMASYGTGIWNGFLYNTKTMNLLGTKTVSGPTRGVARLHLQAKSNTAEDFYIYSAHLKAGSGGSDQSKRFTEVNQIRSDADALGQGENVIFTGDMNIYRSSESAYQKFLSGGNGQAFDPINRPGNWHDNSSFKDIHTQDPSGSLGGMDDRFDFQLVSGELLDNVGMDYIQGSYHAFGNTGLHNLNGNITSGPAPNNTITNALQAYSDHLPVVADYVIPTVPEPTSVLMIVSTGSLLMMRRKKAA